MARQLRIQYPGAYYHVTCRGNERHDIYREADDYILFLEKLSDSLEVYKVSLLSYACMTNHFHLLLTTPLGNLSDFMRHFNISYTSAFNRKYQRTGHLYQGRFKSYLVDADAYLCELSRYIHLNPVRIKKNAKIGTQKKMNILEQYKYSSFAGYGGLVKREKFINYSTILDYFGGDTPEGQCAYREFVLRGLDDKSENPHEVAKGTGIVGSPEFVKSVERRYVVQGEKKNLREQPCLRSITKVRPDELIDKYCEYIGKDQGAICGKGKNSIDRAILMELLYQYCSITQPEIGRLLGGIDYSAVSVSRKRLRRKKEIDPSISQKIEGFVEILSRIEI